MGIRCLFGHDFKKTIKSVRTIVFTVSFFGKPDDTYRKKAYLGHKECQRCGKLHYFVDGLDSSERNNVYPTEEIIKYELSK